MKQRTLERRIDCWSENLKRVWEFTFRRVVVADEKPTSAAAIDAALLIVREAGIELQNRDIDKLLGMVASLSIGALTSVTLSPWVGVPLGVGMEMAAEAFERKYGFRKRLHLHTSGEHLRKLAAGRLRCIWS